MANNTSITESKSVAFLRVAQEQDRLRCDRITGFFLQKTRSGASWRYRYQSVDGKRRVYTIGRFSEFKPEAAALKALEWRQGEVDIFAEKEEAQKQDALRKLQESQRTLEQYLTGAYALHLSRQKSGAATEAMIKNHFAHLLDRDMSSITESDISTWQNLQEKKGLKHATLKRSYAALKALLNRATNKDRLIENNPLANVGLLEPTHDEVSADIQREQSENKRRLLTDSEIASLKNGLEAFAEEIRQQRRNSITHGKKRLKSLDDVHYPHWFIPFTYIALYTGLRAGDIYGLTWKELNLNFKRLHKIPEKTRHHREPVEITIPLPDELVAIMKQWRIEQGNPQDGLVFVSERTGKRIVKGAHVKNWQKLLRLANLPDDLVFYSLRHNFISTLVADGIPLFTVARLVGHKGTKMIEQHYGHLCPQSSEQALRSITSRLANIADDATKAAQ